jgi:hypothetical protein
MPAPLAICLEDLDATPGAPRYLRCCAVVGRQPGLRVDSAGAVLWQGDADVAAELWVSGDDQLILYRPEGAPASTVRRAGREVTAPVGKPVVLRDQDEIDVGGRHLRVHVHGPAPAVAEPTPLPEEAAAAPLTEPTAADGAADAGPSAFARAAAALALGAALGAGGCVEVRNNPPDMAPTPRPRDGGPPPSPAPTGGQRVPIRVDAGVAAKPGTPTKPGPIEVRVAPPAVAMPPRPPQPPTKPGAPTKPAPAKPDPKPESK